VKGVALLDTKCEACLFDVSVCLMSVLVVKAKFQNVDDMMVFAVCLEVSSLDIHWISFPAFSYKVH
jgi:hypothetical protein